MLRKKKVKIKTKYLYITTASSCINNKVMTLLYLLNSLAQQRRREIIIINNNKIYSSKLFSTRINENSTIKYVSKKHSLR